MAISDEINDFLKVRDSIDQTQQRKAAIAAAQQEYELELAKYKLEAAKASQEMRINARKEIREARKYPSELAELMARTEKTKQESQTEKVKRLKEFRSAQAQKAGTDFLQNYQQGQTPVVPQVGGGVPGQSPAIPAPTRAGISVSPSGVTITPRSEAEQFMEYQNMYKAADEPRRYKMEQTVKRLDAIESDPFIKDYQEIDRNVRSLVDLHKEVSSGNIKFSGEYTAGILNLYQRLVDPKGVVRSGDLDLIVKNLGIRRQWGLAVQKISTGGGLDKEGAETILKIASALGNTYGQKYNEYIKSKVNVAERLGYDKEILEKSLPTHTAYDLGDVVKSKRTKTPGFDIESVVAPYRKQKNG